ncbi:MAG: AMP-binding protein [Meiothermus sp.]|uniref:AMP-binding protein n=1 Tax=Meiothermus sp. TaxID=1955249 RepID=UPI0025E02A71|nr:AMP-binding protein [Meiothermus sp.]MCS7057445.1 AMP-binding protein [Meiothermus sp.]MCS7193553.1 AMP-binding protein [Meiothermus sp.]MCX7739994.1 AMP-binding protein [Meiothermus sp.]MDW8091600.1 AMP-binding protein [Meiothermus sp.]MDW8481530.1 AMP-binding protein [Meiothermus sp.]
MKTLLDYLAHHAEVHPRAPAMRVKRYGVWETTSWAHLQEKVEHLAGGLLELGLEPGGVLAILGQNAPEWVEAELAAQTLGVMPMGIYADAMPEEVGYFIEFSECQGVVVSDEEQLDKVLPHLDRLRFVLVWEEAGMSRYWGEKVRPFSSALGRGPHHRAQVEAARAQVGPDTVALLAPTSGTTARSKLAMLTHAQLIAGAEAGRATISIRGGEWVFSYLPLPWIGEQMLTVVRSLTDGTVVHFPEDPVTLREDVKEVQPDFYLAPARLWEDAAALVRSRMADADGLKRAVYRWGMGVLLECAQREFRKEPIGFGLNLARSLAYPLVARPIRARLGLAACRIAATGGAPLGPEVFTFFRALGVDIRQVYGQSETAATTVAHLPGDTPPETVGKPLPNTQVRIAPDGEIQVKGPQVFAGYFKNEAATRESFTEDGWFRTGDAGFFNENGHLILLGRLKEVGALADGTRFAPQFLENRLKYSPYIREAVVIGHGRPFVTALIELDPENTQNWARKRGIVFTTYQSLAAHPEVYALIAQELGMACASLPEELRVRRFAVLPKELHADDEEVTRTRKVKRGTVEARYAELLRALYDGSTQVRLTLPIRYLEGQGTLEAEVRIADVGPPVGSQPKVGA